MPEPFEVFQRRIRSYRRDLQQVQGSMSYARKLISKELDIGPGQCSRIVNAIRPADEPLREFSELLETPEYLPLSAKSIRHSLLIALDSARSLLHSLMHDIDVLHVVYEDLSYHEAAMHREHILNQLETFNHRKDDIVHTIDRLLFTSTANR